MKTLIAISAAALTAASANATVQLYTNASIWAGAANTLYPSNYTIISDTLTYATQTSPNLVTSTSSGNGYHTWANWTAAASSGNLTLLSPGSSAADMVAVTNNASITITFTNSTGNVQTGIMGAGIFFSYTASGSPTNGDITVTFANGLTSTITQNLSGGFVGVWNQNPDGANWNKISSITLSVANGSGNLAISGVEVGLVPAPGAVALVGVAGLVGSRRRRA